MSIKDIFNLMGYSILIGIGMSIALIVIIVSLKTLSVVIK